MPIPTDKFKFLKVPSSENPIAPSVKEINNLNWERLERTLNSGVNLGVVTRIRQDSDIELSGTVALQAGPYVSLSTRLGDNSIIISGTGVQLLNNMSGISQLIAGPNITITNRRDNNTIEISGAAVGGGTGVDDAQYVVLSGHASLTNERVLTAGPFIYIEDKGANQLVVISGTGLQLLNNQSGISNILEGPGIDVVTMPSNNTIRIDNTGVTSLNSFTSGIQIAAGPNIIINTETTNRITISGISNENTIAPRSSAYVTIGNDSILTNERALTAGPFINIQDNGANNQVIISGTGVQLLNNLSGILGLIAGPNITITPRRDNNTIEISGLSAGGGSDGAPTNATYITLSNDATLTNERVLTAGPFINIQDTGANGLVIISGIGVQQLNNFSGILSLIAGPGIHINVRSHNNTIEISGCASHTHIWNETPAGNINGANTVFTLTNQPMPSESLLLFKNGLLQRAGGSNDFTLSSQTVTFLAGNIPQTGDVLLASYTLSGCDGGGGGVGAGGSSGSTYDPVTDPLLLCLTGSA